jgi:hypothetical protein
MDGTTPKYFFISGRVHIKTGAIHAVDFLYVGNDYLTHKQLVGVIIGASRTKEAFSDDDVDHTTVAGYSEMTQRQYDVYRSDM